jgi:hypothetical protein
MPLIGGWSNDIVRQRAAPYHLSPLRGRCRRQFDVPASAPTPPDAGWTGAEIRSCCRLSALLDLPLGEAARYVVPVSVTAAEGVDQLRSWARGCCLNADRGGLYQRPTPAVPRRRVTPPTTAN